MQFFNRQFRILFVLIAISFATVSAFAQERLPEVPPGSKRIEGDLAGENYYLIPQSMTPLTYLNELVLVLGQDLVRNPEYGSRTHLQMGDAYHWIGHIFEDRGDYESAWEALNKSYEHFLLSESTTSPLINNLRTGPHARFHLKRLAMKLNRSMPMGMTKVPQIKDQILPTDNEVKNYRLEVEKSWDRVNPTSRPRICRRFF